jgi:type IV secretory pathway VirB10-like protein
MRKKKWGIVVVIMLILTLAACGACTGRSSSTSKTQQSTSSSVGAKTGQEKRSETTAQLTETQTQAETEATEAETQAEPENEPVAVSEEGADTVFEPQDVSDATIESIRTYGDYLIMYRKILDDYFAEYESLLKGTILYSEDSFQQMKDQMDQAFDEQEKQYGAVKDQRIVGKDTLVEVLKEYRDSLADYINTFSQALG